MHACLKSAQNILCTLIVLTLAAACGPADLLSVQAPVKQGRRAQTGRDQEFLARTVKIRVSGKGHRLEYCSASVVAEDLLLTAAHCLPKQGLTVAIGVGSAPFVKGAQGYEFRTHRYRAYPRPFKSKFSGKRYVDDHDIALIHFEGGLRRGLRVNDLLEDHFSFHRNTPIIAAGYGDLPKAKGGGYLHVTEDLRIASATKTSFFVGQAGDHSPGIQPGDSGGPAFVRDGGVLKLWGIHSAIIDYNMDSEAGLIVDLRHYRSWLHKTAYELRLEASPGEPFADGLSFLD